MDEDEGGRMTGCYFYYCIALVSERNTTDIDQSNRWPGNQYSSACKKITCEFHLMQMLEDREASLIQESESSLFCLFLSLPLSLLRFVQLCSKRIAKVHSLSSSLHPSFFILLNWSSFRFLHPSASSFFSYLLLAFLRLSLTHTHSHLPARWVTVDGEIVSLSIGKSFQWTCSLHCHTHCSEKASREKTKKKK